MVNTQKNRKSATVQTRLDAGSSDLWAKVNAAVVLIFVGLAANFVTTLPVQAAPAAREKADVKASSDQTAVETASPRKPQTSDRSPARVEGDLSPEANELLHDAGQKFERMLDRSTRGY